MSKLMAATAAERELKIYKTYFSRVQVRLGALMYAFQRKI